MAKVNQFYRGEVINLRITMEEGDILDNPSLYTYLDNLDLSNESNIKEAKLVIPTGETEISDGNYAVFERQYELLEEEPDDWDTNYTSYYTKNSQGIYVPVTGETAPTFAQDTYYALSDTFMLNGKQTRQLTEGTYTIELSYGNTDANRKIVKINTAYTLIGSVSRYKNTNQ